MQTFIFKNESQRSHWSVAILKSIQVNVENSLISFQILKKKIRCTALHSEVLILLSDYSFFFMKDIMCFQISSLLSLLPASRIVGVQLPLSFYTITLSPSLYGSSTSTNIILSKTLWATYESHWHLLKSCIYRTLLDTPP